MANAICNLDTHGQIVYPVNEGMSDVVRSTEIAWCRLFYDMETMVGNSSYHFELSIILPLTYNRLSRFIVP